MLNYHEASFCVLAEKQGVLFCSVQNHLRVIGGDSGDFEQQQ